MLTRVDVFDRIFLVFLGLGTLVGIIVVAYTLYNAYKYRDDGDRKDEDLPTLGELPTGGGSGKKLFVSFLLSAVIVISLVIWTYGMLLYVEDGPEDNPDGDAIEIDVQGEMFSWSYEYENGVESNELVVPEDEAIWLNVTSTDVWHAFGISELRVKADAIPGEHDETWFIAEDTGDYMVECFELCGAGHSAMEEPMEVKTAEDYDEWMDEQIAEMEEEEEDDDAEDEEDDGAENEEGDD